ncbi:hypothetical protein AJ80_09318 [Polytolypa hystricis UAMH7299]|uniref:UmuC domain-containing protein n=1 Tax=Polytolypa hystricis (strain UAMH7299) TaxID=1447883 RepID=A0A2B7WJS0_POLH7|nr:hypothetical protein AJ80_09318 [Polytolypa hystricis UAMH7299]
MSDELEPIAGLWHSFFGGRDYDCFYASVFEAENPALKSLPLAVQQKQIVVTCNYEARRRGLRKLQLIKQARKLCPDVVVMLGEDLTKFRDASKCLYAFLKGFIWGNRAERLGFDEVFLDVTSMIDYNVELLNYNDLPNSFFQLDKSDPTVGFVYDATTICGPTYPPTLIPNGSASCETSPESHIGTSAFEPGSLYMRLIIGSHLAYYLRRLLEESKGYTSTVGISTSKLLSKLVGNVHKPRSQTTLLPPYDVEHNDDGRQESNVIRFLGPHDIGRIPGIGFKTAQRIRSHALGREQETGVYEELVASDTVTTHDLRSFPGMGPVLLDNILCGGGWPKGTGTKVWGLINGIDPTPVADARAVPTQISIEDSYAQLERLEDVTKELIPIARNLLRRMRVDLTADDNDDDSDNDYGNQDTHISQGERPSPRKKKRWLAHPRTLRLSTRLLLPPNPDGIRNFNSSRTSRSCPMPVFIFSFNEDIPALADRLVHQTIVPQLFRKLHPENSGWKINLLNIAVTNMVESGGSERGSSGRDIGKMFRNQERVLSQWRVEDRDVGPDSDNVIDGDTGLRSIDVVEDMEGEGEDEDGDGGDDEGTWDSDGDTLTECNACAVCGVRIPYFAVKAHELYHSLPD